MERINKFLNNRPVKHKKVLVYRGEKYEITKEDLKKVRAFRAGKCLDPSFKLDRPLDLSFSSKIQDSPLQVKQKKDLSDYFNRRIIKKISSNRSEKPQIIRKDKNQIVDIWEDQGIDDIKQCNQEWKYSIKEQYSGPVEDLKYTKEFLEEELNKIHMKYFRPRELKEKSLTDLLPKIPDLKEMKPFPEFVAAEWNIKGRKNICNDLVCATNENSVEIWNLKYNFIVKSFSIENSIKSSFINSQGNAVVQTSKSLFFADENNISQFVESEAKIKDVFFNSEYCAVLTKNNVNLYNAYTTEYIKTINFKNSSVKKVKAIGESIIASTSNGLFVARGDEILEINYLSCIIDFDSKNDKIFAINNLNRLIILDKKFTIVKSIVQHEMGTEIKVHPLLNLIAIVFSNEIGVYKIINGEVLPTNSIPGKFKMIHWHETMPWIYAGTDSKIILFS